MRNLKGLIVFLAVILLLILTAGCYQPSAELGSVAVGQAAPGFSLKDLEGKEVSLDQYRGKIVVLDFWATWCGPCRQTMPILDAIQEQYRGKLVLLAINLQESKDKVREYVLGENLNARVLLDEDSSVGSLYGVSGIPMQVIIDQNGTIQRLVTGFGPGMEYQMKKKIDQLLNESDFSVSR